jgi:MFS family permease
VVGFALMGIFTLTIPFTHTLWLLMLTQALENFGAGLAFPVLMALSIKYMPPQKRATAMGFYQAIYGLGMFIGPVLMGIIADWLELAQGFLVLGVLGCLTAGLSQWLIRSDEPANPGSSASSSSI